MDSLIAKAEAIQPLTKKRKTAHYASRSGRKKPEKSASSLSDTTYNSISQQTSLPKSLRPTSPAPNVSNNSHIANKKLRTELTRNSVHAARSKALLKDAELLLADEVGKMEVDGEMEKTWRVGQDEIMKSAGQEAAKGRRELKLDGGPYRSRYTRNGRYD
jgi:U3 small nucleolar RNA-associated protein 7